jgi:feruloyl esterase
MVNPPRRTLFVLGLLTLGLGTAWPAAATQPTPVPTAADCAALLTAQLSFKDQGSLDYRYAGGVAAHSKRVEPVLTKATLVPATATVPEYCRVEGSIPTGNATEGTNAVRFGVNLPTGWNGRFVMIGDGGFDGAVSASTVRVPQGYATANSDMGHGSQQFPGATFGFNNRARELDYGFRATHLATVAAKGLIDVYYKRGPRFSYWDGCSTGGRQAAVEAQRFPDDFDGIVAGDLFNNAVEVAMEQIWSSATFFADRNNDGVGFDNNVTQADLDALRDAVLAKCDVLGNDKIKDNVVGNHRLCARVFTAADVDAFGAARGLTAGQIQALKDVYSGPHDSTGRRHWSPGKPHGSEFNWGSFVVPTPANNNFPAQGGFSFELVNFLFFETDPGVPTARRNDPTLLPGPGEYRWLDFNFDTNTPRGRSVHPVTGPWTSHDGGGFMRSILNGSETDLSPFLVHRNAKYLLYHGAADGLIATDNTVDYYEGIVRDTFHGHTRQAQENVRLFLVPGMGHCAGGVRGAAVGWDKLPALVEWVEHGHAPDQIVVTQDAGTTTPDGNERIICPWPLQPTYIGPEGTENTPANWVATNFACRAERRPDNDHHHQPHDGDHDGGFRLPWWR